MSKNHLHVVTLCAAIVSGITFAFEVKQHNFVDGDERNAFGYLIEDSFFNMKQLRDRNLTINEIQLDDDSNVKFHNISITKLPENTQSAPAVQISIECVLNDRLKVRVPLGHYEVTGSVEITGEKETYAFIMSMRNVDLNIKWHQPNSPNTGEDIDITIEKKTFISAIPVLDQIASALNSRIPSQFYTKLYAQIEKPDLLSYFSTAKHHCLGSRANGGDRYYVINQTHVFGEGELDLFRREYHNFTIESINITNFYSNYTISLSNSFYDTGYLIHGSNIKVTSNGYYYRKGDDALKNPVRYDFQPLTLEAKGHLDPIAGPTDRRFTDLSSWISFSDVAWIKDSGPWVDVLQRSSRIIIDDLLSIINQRY